MRKIKNYNFILFVITLLSISFSSTGCYSYYTISREDLASNKPENSIKIILNNENEVIIKNPDNIISSNLEEIIVIQSDSTKKTYTKHEIGKILEERFDFGKTFFSTMWITAIILLITLGVLWSS